MMFHANNAIQGFIMTDSSNLSVFLLINNVKHMIRMVDVLHVLMGIRLMMENVFSSKIQLVNSLIKIVLYSLSRTLQFARDAPLNIFSMKIMYALRSIPIVNHGLRRGDVKIVILGQILLIINVLLSLKIIFRFQALLTARIPQPMDRDRLFVSNVCLDQY